MKTTGTFLLRITLLALWSSSQPAMAADDSLHAVIDQHLSSPLGMTPALCRDADFLRRASLDLTGIPPTADDVRAFLADENPDKRTAVIDKLIGSPHFDRHLATTLDVMLMERLANPHVPQDEWYGWLLKSVQENKPWNVLVREILAAGGDDPAMRAAARFYLARECEPNRLTRDIGRIFFGRDLQCAQCHDHPLISDYLQSDYHGLLAFVAPGYAVVRKEKMKEGDKETTKDVTYYAEKAGSDLTFESVFIQGTLHRTGPRLFDDVEITEPVFYPGEEYEVEPADGTIAVPKFSRREKLAELATNGSNRKFNENIANRLWAHMLGRGLVHPVDLHHCDNPATDPELLRLLGERFAAMNFDISGFLRELALTRIYQRSFDRPDDLLANAGTAAGKVTELEGTQAILSKAAETSASAFYDADEKRAAAEAALLPVASELDKARAAYAEAKKNLDKAQQELAKAQGERDQKTAAQSIVQAAADAAQKAIGLLKDDKELAAATETFAKRANELADAVAAATKTVEEKTAAVAAPAKAFAAAKPPVDAAREQLVPLRDALRLSEEATLAARRTMRHDAAALASLERKIETARQVAALPQLHQSIAANQTLVAEKEKARDAAQNLLSQYADVVALRQTEAAAAEQGLAAATTAITEAQAAFDKRQEITQAVSAASIAAGAASAKVPEDTVLADAAQKLQQRLDALSSEMGQLQSNLDKANGLAETARQSLATAQEQLNEALAERSRRETSVAEAEGAVTHAKAEVVASRETYEAAVSKLTGRWASNFSLASLKPLTPEQLCWSIFRVTGVYERYWQVEATELEKSAPLTEEQKQDPAQLAARNREIEQRTYDKLKGNVGTFVKFYGAGAGQPQDDFFATADQALFAANGGSINSWVAPAGGNVTERIVNATDPKVAAEELYLTVLSRLPSEEESAEVAKYLASRDADRAAAAQELVWSLLNSIAFRFNH